MGRRYSREWSVQSASNAKVKNGQLAMNGMGDRNWTTAHGSVDWEGGGEADQASL